MAEQDEPVRRDALVAGLDLVCAVLIVFGWVIYIIGRDLGDLRVSAVLAIICSAAHADDVWASARWMLARARGRVHDGGTPPPKADGPARS